MSKKENNPYLLVLTDNNGKDDEFEVLDIISFHENEYFVLYPVNSNGDTVVILVTEIVNISVSMIRLSLKLFLPCSRNAIKICS